MIAQLSQITAERGSGRIELPAYTWIDRGFSCITFDWIGNVSYTPVRTVQHLYRLGYQVKGVGTAILGQIEFVADQDAWLIRSVGRHALPSGESLVYPTWEAARDYLWEQHQETKRKAVANFESRLKQHCKGRGAAITRAAREQRIHLRIEVVACFPTFEEARKLERRLKKWHCNRKAVNYLKQLNGNLYWF